jgi:hypothetical protein
VSLGVVYLNGTELFRSPSLTPMPTPITFTTFANPAVRRADAAGLGSAPASGAV